MCLLFWPCYGFDLSRNLRHHLSQPRVKQQAHVVKGGASQLVSLLLGNQRNHSTTSWFFSTKQWRFWNILQYLLTMSRYSFSALSSPTATSLLCTGSWTLWLGDLLLFFTLCPHNVSLLPFPASCQPLCWLYLSNKALVKSSFLLDPNITSWVSGAPSFSPCPK